MRSYVSRLNPGDMTSYFGQHLSIVVSIVKIHDNRVGYRFQSMILLTGYADQCEITTCDFEYEYDIVDVWEAKV